TPFRPTPRHPTTAQQTSGTADCSRAAPSTAAPSAPNRTPATAEREATAQAGSTAGQVERRAFQIPATVPPAPHPRSAGSTATDDLLEPAPRSSRSRTAHRSSHPNRASDVPHISSRSADYTPTPGPIERLFPHPAKSLSKWAHRPAATPSARWKMSADHERPVGLHYREDEGRADAEQQHAVRRLQRSHHPPVAFQHESRCAAGANRIDRIENRLSGRVERAKPPICRRPKYRLYPV